MPKNESNRPTDGEPYTIEKALAEARNLLKNEFGDAKQDAAVSLATFLYQAHERERFLEREGSEPPGSVPYGGGTS